MLFTVTQTCPEPHEISGLGDTNARRIAKIPGLDTTFIDWKSQMNKDVQENKQIKMVTFDFHLTIYDYAEPPATLLLRDWFLCYWTGAESFVVWLTCPHRADDFLDPGSDGSWPSMPS